MKYVFLIFTLLFLPSIVFAGGLQDAFGGSSPLSTVQRASGAPTSDLGTITGTIISAALSLVGIMFLLLMVYSGYLWMTARGDEQQVEKAQKIIRGTVIGLVITLSAYAITLFITSNLLREAGSSQGTGNSGNSGSGTGSGAQSVTCVFQLGSGGGQTTITVPPGGNSQALCNGQCQRNLASYTQVNCTYDATGRCSWTDPNTGSTGSQTGFSDRVACQSRCQQMAFNFGTCLAQ